MKNNKDIILLLTGLILILATGQILSFNPFPGQPACEGCLRSASVDIKTNAGDRMISSIRMLLAESFVSPCFHIKVPASEIPERFRGLTTGDRPPEYMISAEFLENLSGEITSSLEVNLYYIGTTRELVKGWKTEHSSQLVSFPWHRNKWVENRDAIARSIRPVEATLLKDFEKRPETCKIEVSNEDICAGEVVDITVTGINDYMGRSSREFNRIVVQAVEGKILNGESAALDPDLKAFKVGNGRIQVRYKAPDPGGPDQDTIYVYNSCEILREDLLPLSQTQPRDKIAEQKIDFSECIVKDAVLTLRKNRQILDETHNKFFNSREDKVEKRNWDESVTINIQFEKNPQFSIPLDENSVHLVYKISSWSVLDSHFSRKGEGFHREFGDMFGKTKERVWDENATGTVLRATPVSSMAGIDLEIQYNTKTKQIEKVEKFPYFDILVQWRGWENCWSWERGQEKKDCSQSLDEEKIADLSMNIAKADISHSGKTMLLKYHNVDQGSVTRTEVWTEIKINRY